MTFAYGFEKVLRAEEFQITLIYSVSTFTKEDERIEQIAHDEYFMPLNPWDQYAGRVPEFLSPLEEVREASGDHKK